MDRSTLLLIEDDPVYTRLVQAGFSKAEDPAWDILMAGTLESGLARLAASPDIELILLDLGLPDSDGFESFLAVRNAAPEAAIIVLSGLDDKELARRSVREGAQDYIVKGSTGEKDLPRACGYAVARKQSEVALRQVARQQAAVTQLGQQALAGVETAELLQDGVAMVARTLSVPMAEVFEWTEGGEMVLRAAVGWDAAKVGQPLASGRGSHLVAVLEKEGTLVVNAASGKGLPDGLVLDEACAAQGVVSGACVTIRGDAGPFGVLSAHTVTPREFNREDLHFLELVANVLASAVVREQVEEVFRVSEAGYRHILDTASEGICALNAQGQVTYVNRRAAAMLLYESPEDLLGRPIQDFLFSEDWADGPDLLAQWNQGRQHQSDFRLQRRDGTDLWVLASTSPILDNAGQFAGALTMFTDVTARRRAEKALQESEARYRRIVETANEGIWVADRHGVTEYVNRVLARMLGYTITEMLGRPMLDFVFDDDRETTREIFSARRPSNAEPVTLRLRRKGGAEIWVMASTNTIVGESGEVEGLLAMCGDITARRRAEAERQRLSSAVEQAAEAIMMTRRDGTIVYVNPAWQRLSGYAANEVLGLTPRILKSDVQDPKVYRDLWETILDGRVWQGEITNRRKNGELFTLEETITPVRDPNGRITEFIAFGQDTSGRRDLEARLRQAQKMEAVGRLAGGVAHDFNNLLTVITGYSERLLNGLGEGDPLRRGAEAIKRSADRAAALTQQLLAFSRRQILAPRVLDLNAVVTNMHKLLQRLIGEDIELVLRPGEGLGRVKADPNQVEQVLMNLAVNSRDAMEKGGTLTIETSNVEFNASYAARHVGLQPGNYVMLAVTDTGCGMSAETQAHLFEPFFTTKEQGKGTGLGLSTIYGIVKQSGGYVAVESELGRGSTFRVYLPRIEEALDAALSPQESTAPRHGSETILLVEDEEAVRNLLRDILRRFGYTVLEASNGPEAIEICHSHLGPIHLVITDMVMPQMSGWEVAEAVGMLRPKARIIYMSGYIEHVVVEERVLEAGVAFLGKPFTPETLGRKVREVLDGQPAT